MKKEGLKIYLGADHAGFELKEKIKGFLDSKKINACEKSPAFKLEIVTGDFSRQSQSPNKPHPLRCGKLKGFVIYEDLGAFSKESVDYSDIAFKVAEKVSADKGSRGILICGTGIGMCIAANKVNGIRAAMVYDEQTARMSREHNDANVICLRGRDFSDEENLRLLEIWLNTKFSGDERHLRRLGKIEGYEYKRQ